MKTTRRDLFKQLLGQAPATPTRQSLSTEQRKKLAYKFAPPRSLSSTLAPYTGEWGRNQAIHLLKRLCFGSKQDDLNLLQAANVNDCVEGLLAPVPNDGSLPINNYNSTENNEIDPNVPFGETWVNAPPIEISPAMRYRQIISFKGWWLRKMIQNTISIEEKMILFWHNHFATESGPTFDGRITFRHFQMLRTHALGNVKALTKAVTLDIQMLEYLNGGNNTAGAPDENYARELQELFCIGKGAASQYTEDDVQEAARVLTGWRIHYPTLTVEFNPSLHDNNDKHFSAFYNNTVIQGRQGADGANELDDLLDMLFANPECALHFCRKIYRFFVYHNIDAQTEATIIVPLAQILRDNNYEILPVLRTLFKSEHFYDPANLGAMIKSPMDMMMGFYREFGIYLPPDNFSEQMNDFWSGTNYLLMTMQQQPCDPPNVAGWLAYYQEPVYDKSWISTDSYPRRVNFTMWLLWGFGFLIEGSPQYLNIDVKGFTQTMPNADTTWGLINDVTRILCIEVPTTVKYQLRYTLLQGQENDAYWTEAWTNWLNDPTEMNAHIVENLLKPFYHQILLLEEYHLM